MHLRTAIACLAAAASAAAVCADAAPSPASPVRRCAPVRPDAGAVERQDALRCLLNDTRRRRGRTKLRFSVTLQRAAQRLLSVSCRRSTAGCGGAFEAVLSAVLRARHYNGRVQYVYYDVSDSPAAVAAYIRSNQSWLSSGRYRDLGIAFRPGGASSKSAWIVIAGYRF